jgi:hypothetical protein
LPHQRHSFIPVIIPRELEDHPDACQTASDPRNHEVQPSVVVLDELDVALGDDETGIVIVGVGLLAEKGRVEGFDLEF